MRAGGGGVGSGLPSRGQVVCRDLEKVWDVSQAAVWGVLQGVCRHGWNVKGTS